MYCDGCNSDNPECVGSCQPTPDVQSYEKYERPSLVTPSAPHPLTDLTPSYEYMISRLNDNDTRLILAELALISPVARTVVASSFLNDIQMQRGPDINFSHYSTKVWRLLDTNWWDSDSEEFEDSYDVCVEIVICIKAISAEALAQGSYTTKLSALETLCKIARTILLARGIIGSEVRKQFQLDSCLAESMMCVVESMTPAERWRAGDNMEDKDSLANKLRWVCNKADVYCLGGFDGLRNVLALIDDSDNPDGPGE